MKRYHARWRFNHSVSRNKGCGNEYVKSAHSSFAIENMRNHNNKPWQSFHCSQGYISISMTFWSRFTTSPSTSWYPWVWCSTNTSKQQKSILCVAQKCFMKTCFSMQTRVQVWSEFFREWSHNKTLIPPLHHCFNWWIGTVEFSWDSTSGISGISSVHLSSGVYTPGEVIQSILGRICVNIFWCKVLRSSLTETSSSISLSPFTFTLQSKKIPLLERGKQTFWQRQSDRTKTIENRTFWGFWRQKALGTVCFLLAKWRKNTENFSLYFSFWGYFQAISTCVFVIL